MLEDLQNSGNGYLNAKAPSGAFFICGIQTTSCDKAYCASPYVWTFLYFSRIIQPIRGIYHDVP